MVEKGATSLTGSALSAYRKANPKQNISSGAKSYSPGGTSHRYQYVSTPKSRAAARVPANSIVSRPPEFSHVDAYKNHLANSNNISNNQGAKSALSAHTFDGQKIQDTWAAKNRLEKHGPQPRQNFKENTRTQLGPHTLTELPNEKNIRDDFNRNPVYYEHPRQQEVHMLDDDARLINSELNRQSFVQSTTPKDQFASGNIAGIVPGTVQKHWNTKSAKEKAGVKSALERQRQKNITNIAHSNRHWGLTSLSHGIDGLDDNDLTVSHSVKDIRKNRSGWDWSAKGEKINSIGLGAYISSKVGETVRSKNYPVNQQQPSLDIKPGDYFIQDANGVQTDIFDAPANEYKIEGGRSIFVHGGDRKPVIGTTSPNYFTSGLNPYIVINNKPKIASSSVSQTNTDLLNLGNAAVWTTPDGTKHDGLENAPAGLYEITPGKLIVKPESDAKDTNLFVINSDEISSLNSKLNVFTPINTVTRQSGRKGISVFQNPDPAPLYNIPKTGIGATKNDPKGSTKGTLLEFSGGVVDDGIGGELIEVRNAYAETNNLTHLGQRNKIKLQERANSPVRDIAYELLDNGLESDVGSVLQSGWNKRGGARYLGALVGESLAIVGTAGYGIWGRGAATGIKVAVTSGSKNIGSALKNYGISTISTAKSIKPGNLGFGNAFASQTSNSLSKVSNIPTALRKNTSKLSSHSNSIFDGIATPKGTPRQYRKSPALNENIIPNVKSIYNKNLIKLSPKEKIQSHKQFLWDSGYVIPKLYSIGTKSQLNAYKKYIVDKGYALRPQVKSPQASANTWGLDTKNSFSTLSKSKSAKKGTGRWDYKKDDFTGGQILNADGTITLMRQTLKKTSTKTKQKTKQDTKQKNDVFNFFNVKQVSAQKIKPLYDQKQIQKSDQKFLQKQNQKYNKKFAQKQIQKPDPKLAQVQSLKYLQKQNQKYTQKFTQKQIQKQDTKLAQKQNQIFAQKQNLKYGTKSKQKQTYIKSLTKYGESYVPIVPKTVLTKPPIKPIVPTVVVNPPIAPARTPVGGGLYWDGDDSTGNPKKSDGKSTKGKKVYINWDVPDQPFGKLRVGLGYHEISSRAYSGLRARSRRRRR